MFSIDWLAVYILLVVTILGFFDMGSPIFCQQRVGKNKRHFIFIKFRTVSVDTESNASHLVSSTSIAKLGDFFRKKMMNCRN